MLARTPVRPNRQRRTEAKADTAPAPVKGWNTKSPLESMDPLYAVELRNWFPQPGWVEVRKGQDEHATEIGTAVQEIATPASDIDDSTDTITITAHGLDDDTPVKVHATTTLPGGLSAATTYYIINGTTDTFQLSESVGGSAVDITDTGSGAVYVYELLATAAETLAIWEGPASSKLFAAGGGAIWDVTATQPATLSYDGQHLLDRWQWCMHTTSAGNFLFMVNGLDAPIHFSGTAWAEPTITGITASDAVGVISHKKRLWLVLDGTTKAAYLATEAITGSATVFEFGSLFTKGGRLEAIATWTRDGGAGPDDYFVAISSKGQAALFSGTDPASASTWALVGVFDVPSPIGRRCFRKYGADLLLITVEGTFPLSQLLSVDQSEVERVSITNNITPTFTRYAALYGANFGWEIAIYPSGNRLFVNVPTAEGSTALQLVMNTITGAWCEYDSHDATCWAVYQEVPYFATTGGVIRQADSGSADVFVAIQAEGQTAYSAYKTARVKQFTMARPLIVASGANRPHIGISTDFIETYQLSSSSVALAAGTALWDIAKWDQATWADSTLQAADWINLAGLGTFGSIKFTAQTGSDAADNPDETMRIQGFVVLHKPGEFI